MLDHETPGSFRELNYTPYSVIFRKQFKPAVIALLLPMFLCIVFCAGERKKRYTKEEEYRSAEGRIPTA
jgi:hypothetical protein